MTDPKTLADALVTKLRAIAALVTELGDDAYISAYEDQFPGSTSLFKSIHELPDSSILVVWMGSGKGSFGKSIVWNHRFSLVVKGGSLGAIWHLIADGVPAGGDGLRFRYTTIHANCYPIHADISADRKTLFISETTTLDYMECSLILTEKGDY